MGLRVELLLYAGFAGEKEGTVSSRSPNLEKMTLLLL